MLLTNRAVTESLVCAALQDGAKTGQETRDWIRQRVDNPPSSGLVSEAISRLEDRGIVARHDTFGPGHLVYVTDAPRADATRFWHANHCRGLLAVIEPTTGRCSYPLPRDADIVRGPPQHDWGGQSP